MIRLFRMICLYILKALIKVFIPILPSVLLIGSVKGPCFWTRPPSIRSWTEKLSKKVKTLVKIEIQYSKMRKITVFSHTFHDIKIQVVSRSFLIPMTIFQCITNIESKFWRTCFFIVHFWTIIYKVTHFCLRIKKEMLWKFRENEFYNKSIWESKMLLCIEKIEPPF